MSRDHSRIGRRLLLISSGLLLVSLAGLAWTYFQLEKAAKATSDAALPIITQLPSFSLTERSGQPFSLQNLLGNVWVADFIFTRCPGPCPLMSARMAELQKDFADDAAVRLLSISVDPEYDTPQILEEYAQRYRARENKWVFLTGAKEEIHRLAKDGFLVGGVEDVMTHTTRFMLVDSSGAVRGYYHSDDPQDLQKLRRHIRKLTKEENS